MTPQLEQGCTSFNERRRVATSGHEQAPHKIGVGDRNCCASRQHERDLTMTTEGVQQVSLPRIKVSVTQADIDQAIPANSGHCMIADAIKRCYVEKYKRKPKGVSVDLQTIRLTDPEKGARFIYLTPVVAQRALLQFDQAIKPTPFGFYVKRNGAQAIPLIKRPSRKKLSAAQKAQRNAATEASRRQRNKRRATIVTTQGGDSYQNHHVKVGGKAPPVAVLTGNRRQFGIKAAGALDAPTQ